MTGLLNSPIEASQQTLRYVRGRKVKISCLLLGSAIGEAVTYALA